MAKFKAILVAVGAILILCLIAFFQHRTIGRQRDDIKRLEHNVDVLTTDARLTFVRDSLRSVEVGTLVTEWREMRDEHERDAQLIKDLRIRLRDVRNVATVTTIYRDTVVMRSVDTVTVAPCLEHTDRWSSIIFCPLDSSLSYEWRDSVTTIVHVSYKRRFLWWRWKPEYKTSVVSHNPRCVEMKVKSIINDE